MKKNCVVCDTAFEQNTPKQILCGSHKCRLARRRVKPQPKECIVCGTTFTHGTAKKKICSVECKKAHRKEYMKKFHKNKTENCVVCGKSFHQLGQSLTCSKECSESLEEARLKRYVTENRAKITKRQREWRESKRPPKIDIQCRECKEYYTPTTRSNREAFCSHSCKVKWWAKDPKTNICTRVRGSIHNCLKKRGMTKGGKTFETLGYTPTDLMNHLESQFVEGMTWDNRDEWHIDHIRPISSFNFDSTEHPDFKKCWALNNLQPLWAGDNIRKKDKWDGVVNA